MPRKPSSEKPLTLVEGRGGWARVTWHAGRADEVVADVRFVFDEPALTLRVVELRVSEPWVRRHRDLPLSRVENAANADANFKAHLGLAMKKAPGDLDVYFSLKSQTHSEKVQPRHRLERSAGRRLDDDFYASVGRAYAEALFEGLNPRKTLAADSNTPADTVARWIREARRRGHLSPGAQGKARA